MEKYIYLCFVFFLFSCANIVTLSGGEKDIYGPKVINSYPQNLSTNFDYKTIIIEFDEYVKFNNVNNIRLAPSCDKSPEIKIVGKRLYINFLCQLIQNTTYNINFSQKIKDLNEGNLLDDYSFIFSTGAHIDSLSISGNVKDLYYGAASRGALVGLYKYDADVSLSKPYYYSFTDETGRFVINNISEGDYIIFSFVDDDNNLTPSQNEMISSPFNIKVSNSLSGLDIGLFKPENKKREYPDNYNKGVIKFTKSSLVGLNIITAGYWNKNDFWVGDGVESVRWLINDEVDSVQLYSQEVLKLELNMQSSIAEILEQKKIVIRSNKPITYIDSSLSPGLILTTPFTIEKNISPKLGERVEVFINSGALVDIDNQTNDSIHFGLDFNKSLFGSLLIINNKQRNQQIELYQQKNVIYSAKILAKPLKLDWLKPGTYKLRSINDDNNNMSWDAGSINLNDFCEGVFIYPESIKIRPNWEVELIIN